MIDPTMSAMTVTARVTAGAARNTGAGRMAVTIVSSRTMEKTAVMAVRAKMENARVAAITVIVPRMAANIMVAATAIIILPVSSMNTASMVNMAIAAVNMATADTVTVITAIAVVGIMAIRDTATGAVDRATVVIIVTAIAAATVTTATAAGIAATRAMVIAVVDMVTTGIGATTVGTVVTATAVGIMATRATVIAVMDMVTTGIGATTVDMVTTVAVITATAVDIMATRATVRAIGVNIATMKMATMNRGTLATPHTAVRSRVDRDMVARNTAIGGSFPKRVVTLVGAPDRKAAGRLRGVAVAGAIVRRGLQRVDREPDSARAALVRGRISLATEASGADPKAAGLKVVGRDETDAMPATADRARRTAATRWSKSSMRC
ncbi:MAG TPA: hypothetical protein VHY91_01900 [Pirellulales bacterium]|jgi:hypothetical protein|nr:hypothetical protein [Pirellulales bacterium]